MIMCHALNQVMDDVSMVIMRHALSQNGYSRDIPVPLKFSNKLIQIYMACLTC